MSGHESQRRWRRQSQEAAAPASPQYERRRADTNHVAPGRGARATWWRISVVACPPAAARARCAGASHGGASSRAAGVRSCAAARQARRRNRSRRRDPRRDERTMIMQDAPMRPPAPAPRRAALELGGSSRPLTMPAPSQPGRRPPGWIQRAPPSSASSRLRRAAASAPHEAQPAPRRPRPRAVRRTAGAHADRRDRARRHVARAAAGRSAPRISFQSRARVSAARADVELRSLAGSSARPQPRPPPHLRSAGRPVPTVEASEPAPADASGPAFATSAPASPAAAEGAALPGLRRPCAELRADGSPAERALHAEPSAAGVPCPEPASALRAAAAGRADHGAMERRASAQALEHGAAAGRLPMGPVSRASSSRRACSSVSLSRSRRWSSP